MAKTDKKMNRDKGAVTLRKPAMESSRKSQTASPFNDPIPIRFKGDDVALVAALKTGHPGAMEALYDRYASHVQRVLARVMGLDGELLDLVQEVFIEAFANVVSLKDGQALKAWLTSIAVFSARQRIRKRRRRRAYWVKDAGKRLEVPVMGLDVSEVKALRETYDVLDALPTDDRIVFTLRYIEGMEITEVADACRVSASTAKRRLKKAQKRFRANARRFPTLVELMEEGERWRVK